MVIPSFTIDFKSLGVGASLLLIGLLLHTFSKRFSTPYLSFSSTEYLTSPGSRTIWIKISPLLAKLAWALFLIAFLNPTLLIPKTAEDLKEEKEEIPKVASDKGIAIYLILDQSGSMAQEVTTRGVDGKTVTTSKIELVKQITHIFVNRHPADLIGLVSFARVPKVWVPLTLDHSIITEKINQLQVVQDKEDDGTALGYAIFKTAHLIAATRHFAKEISNQPTAYNIESTIIIAITDGFQDPNILDRGNRLRTIELDEAAEYAKSQGIRLFILNVDPKLSTQDFAAQRRQMKAITEMTGGGFYQTTESSNFKQIYQDIQKLHKEPIQEFPGPSATPFPYHSYLLYPLFLSLGMLCLALFTFLETVTLKRIP